MVRIEEITGIRVAPNIDRETYIKKVGKRKQLKAELNTVKQRFREIKIQNISSLSSEQRDTLIIDMLTKLSISIAHLENLIIDNFSEPY